MKQKIRQRTLPILLLASSFCSSPSDSFQNRLTLSSTHPKIRSKRRTKFFPTENHEFKSIFFLFDSKSIYKRVNATSRVFWTNDWSTVRCVSSNNVGKRVLITSFLSILQSRQSKEKFFMVGEIGTQSINAPKSFYTFFSKVSSPNQSYFYNRNSAIERQRNSNQKNVQGKKRPRKIGV